MSNKKIIFSEEVDSSISGFALGIAFLLLAIFVMYFDIFGNTFAETVVAIILSIIGIAGTFTELGKINHNEIKGGDDFGYGLCFTLGAGFGILKINNIIVDIVLFLFLMLGMYGLIRGIIEIIYSLNLKRRKSKNKKLEIMQIIVGITELITLVVAIMQFIKEV